MAVDDDDDVGSNGSASSKAPKATPPAFATTPAALSAIRSNTTVAGSGAVAAARGGGTGYTQTPPKPTVPFETTPAQDGDAAPSSKLTVASAPAPKLAPQTRSAGARAPSISPIPTGFVPLDTFDATLFQE